MDSQPPPASWVQQDNAAELQLEEEFAQVLFSLMKDDITAADAIKMFEHASVSMMQQHRYDAMLHLLPCFSGILCRTCLSAPLIIHTVAPSAGQHVAQPPQQVISTQGTVAACHCWLL
jgi:hypothetical protein